MQFINGFHIQNPKDGKIKVKTNKKYTWAIPDSIKASSIHIGDIVLVNCKNTLAPVIVLEIFEDSEAKFNYKKIHKNLGNIFKIK